MAVHVAHPSVRMKGAEADWTPIQCSDRECGHSLLKGPHLHCPFCPQDNLFTDQILLKAHYRVKHVDKGIDFGGLKILRCCRSCVVHGIIHEQKYFKGAHWHCYHCRNGFSRRDEATKHYQQHFRHPQTTIQIVLARDVNQIFSYTSPVPSSTSLVAHLIVPQPQQPLETDASSQGYEEADGHQPQVEYQYTCVSDPNESSTNGEVVLIEIPEDGSKEDLENETCYTEQNLSLLLEEKEHLEKTLEEERSKWAQTEHRMKGTIERLRTKVEYLSNTNTSLKQQLSMMHTSSLKRLTNDSESQAVLDELLQHMSEEHSQLLHHHLAQLRLYAQACGLSKAPAQDSPRKEAGVLVPDLADQSQDISHMAMMPSSEDALGGMEQTVVMTITPEEDSESLGNIVDNPEDTVDHDTLDLDKDIQMSPNVIQYQLTSEGLSPKSAISEAGHVYQSDNPHHSRGCDIEPEDFRKHKSLKLILSNSTPKIFCPDGFDKRTFEKDLSNEEPPLKRGRTDRMKAT